MRNFVKDNKGFISLIDAFFSILILLMVLIAFNMMIDIEIPSLSEESNGFKTSQDIMEIMSSKVDNRDYSTWERITFFLSQNNNSASSKREVKAMLDDFFSHYLEGNFKNWHYAFLETDQLDGYVLSSNGDYGSANSVYVAMRNCGNYSYRLYLF